jgi:ATP10 protein
MLLPLALLFASTLPPAFSPGDTLPILKGEFLDGKSAELPTLARGKVTLLALGFSHDAARAVEGWTKRFRTDFGKDPQVTFYEVPMIGGLGMMAKPFITSGMRKGTPKEDYEHVITVFGGVGFWKERLRFKDEKEAYLILLGQEGAIRWVAHGFVSEEKYGQLSGEVRRLLGRE